MLNHYSDNTAKKLKTLTMSNIYLPENIKIYWLNSETLSNAPKMINSKTHKHSFYEAHFIINGSAHWADKDNNLFELSSGHGIIFPPQARHTIKNFSPDMLRFSLAFSPESTSITNAILSQAYIHHFLLSDRLIDCLDTILLDVEQNHFFTTSIIQNRIWEIICEIIQSISIKENYVTTLNISSDDYVILKAKQYISDNKETLLTCEEVAEYCHFNTKYLSRMFSQQTGETLLEYIHNEKIKYAEELLKDESLTLKQISEMLGFKNEYYFNSFFKRRNGCPPGQFRHR